MKIIIPEKKKELNQGLHVLKKLTNHPEKKIPSCLFKLFARDLMPPFSEIYTFIYHLYSQLLRFTFVQRKKHLFSY